MKSLAELSDVSGWCTNPIASVGKGTGPSTVAELHRPRKASRFREHDQANRTTYRGPACGMWPKTS
eukprot:4047001-Amphidinium_carterae.1